MDTGHRPFVLKKFLAENKWYPFQNWTLEYICKNFNNIQPIVRIGSKIHEKGKILYDSKCEQKKFVSFTEMFTWMNDQQTCENSCWAYLDYKNSLELMDEIQAKMIDWNTLNVVPSTPENWKDSTIWIGTPGAYTPCHFDTYGFNLHAQIKGYKNWIIFPPETEMYETRIPYEESSVFSQLDVIGGDERLREATPYYVCLEPGDLLFVPPKWWHSVQCVNSPLNYDKDERSEKNDDGNICISVNKWFPTGFEDIRESAKEGILKYFIGLLFDGCILSPEDLCLSETDSFDDFEQLMPQIQHRLNNLYSDDHQHAIPSLTGEIHHEPQIKIPRIIKNQSYLKYFIETHINDSFLTFVPKIDFEKLKIIIGKGPLEIRATYNNLDACVQQPLNLKHIDHQDILRAFCSNSVLEEVLNAVTKKY